MAKAFPGRVIIDHRPKTGGVAVESWLAGEFGRGCVSTHLPGSHQDLIASYGGQYSIIITHIVYHPGEMLDPRYQYVTWLRDPVDRVLSWLFYVLQDAPAINEDSKDIKAAAEIFLRSEGRECPDHRFTDYSNHYVHHFSAIDCPDIRNRTVEGRFEAALAAISQYDIVGLYEDFPGFLKETANLVGLEAPPNIKKVNVSKKRPEISSAFRERIIELNEYDIKLYSHIENWKKNNTQTDLPAKARGNGAGWLRHEPKDVLIARPVGGGHLASSVPVMTINERTVLQVDFRNQSPQSWLDTGRFPVRASYHWLLPTGEAHIYDGLRSPLPKGGLPAGESVSIDMTIVAPSEPGVYTLVLSLVQERFSWLERRGFEPAIIQVEVRDDKPAPAPAPRIKWFQRRASAQ